MLRIVKGSALYIGTYRLIRTIAGAVRGLPPHYMEFIRPGEITPQMRSGWEASAGSLTRLAEICRRNGIAFGIVAFPIGRQLADSYDPGRAEPQGRLRRLCHDLDARWIDLLGPFRARRDRKLFFDDIHLTRYGHELAAREIARRLTEGGAGTGQD